MTSESLLLQEQESVDLSRAYNADFYPDRDAVG
jgi:hypothetical protein